MVPHSELSWHCFEGEGLLGAAMREGHLGILPCKLNGTGYWMPEDRRYFWEIFRRNLVAGGRIELPTRGFSIRCSTN
jgi:hypothetical protein